MHVTFVQCYIYKEHIFEVFNNCHFRYFVELRENRNFNVKKPCNDKFSNIKCFKFDTEFMHEIPSSFLCLLSGQITMTSISHILGMSLMSKFTVSFKLQKIASVIERCKYTS